MQHRIRIKRLALALAYAAAGAAEAADDTPAPNAETKLDEVVVTATRSEKTLEKIPGAVTVIMERELAPQFLIAEDPSQARSPPWCRATRPRARRSRSPAKPCAGAGR